MKSSNASDRVLCSDLPSGVHPIGDCISPLSKLGRSAETSIKKEQIEIILLLGRTGRRHALREGVPSGEVEDCEITFVEKMLLQHEGEVRTKIAGNQWAWLHLCARNHARNFLRDVRRRDLRGLLLEIEEIDGDWINALQAEAKMAPDPEATLLRTELWAVIARSIDALIPSVQDMFLRHYLMGESIRSLAERTGRTPHAVEQALYRARKGLQSSLLRLGLTEGEIRHGLTNSFRKRGKRELFAGEEERSAALRPTRRK